MKLRFLLNTVIVIVVACLMSSCFMGGFPDKIKSGFTQEFVDEINKQYELSIPLNAGFIGGYLDNAFRDPLIYVAFTVSEIDFPEMFSEKWRVDAGYLDTSKPDDLVKFDVVAAYGYSGEMFTYVQCSAAKDGVITCLFVGRHPGNSFDKFC